MEIVVHLSGGEIYAYSIQTSALQVENDVQNRKPKAKQQPGYWIWKIPHRKASQTEVSATHRFACPLEEIFGNIPGEKTQLWTICFIQDAKLSHPSLLVSAYPSCGSQPKYAIKMIETRWHWREREGIWVEEARHRFKYHLLHNEWYHMKTL